MNQKQIKEELSKLEEKYCDLVWYARSEDKHDLLKQEKYEILKPVTDVEKKYPEECNQLGLDDNWSHGFNSGMLAATRLVLGLMSRSKMENESALEDFPFLDT